MAEGCSVKMFDGSLGKMYGNERVEKSVETQEPSPSIFDGNVFFLD